jgi:hypothetical protein
MQMPILLLPDGSPCKVITQHLLHVIAAPMTTHSLCVTCADADAHPTVPDNTSPPESEVITQYLLRVTAAPVITLCLFYVC